jgi:hypothetical protein
MWSFRNFNTYIVQLNLLAIDMAVLLNELITWILYYKKVLDYCSMWCAGVLQTDAAQETGYKTREGYKPLSWLQKPVSKP